MDSIWITLAIAGLLTFLTRLSFFWLLERWRPPDLFIKALRFVPTAVLSAIIFPEVLAPNSLWNFSMSNPRILAALVAGLVAWRTRNAALTVFMGLLALWLLNWLGL